MVLCLLTSLLTSLKYLIDNLDFVVTVVFFISFDIIFIMFIVTMYFFDKIKRLLHLEINEKLNLLIFSNSLIKTFKRYSFISNISVLIFLIILFLNSNENLNKEIFFKFLLPFFLILCLIYFAIYPEPHVENEIIAIYSNELYFYRVFFYGYKHFREEKVLLLELPVHTKEVAYSYKELKLLQEFLVKFYCIHRDIKTILWFPELIYIPLLITFKIEKLTILYAFFILWLVGIYIIKVYILYLLFVFFNRPIKILIYGKQSLFTNFYIEEKLKKALINFDKKGFNIPAFSFIKEIIPIWGK